MRGNASVRTWILGKLLQFVIPLLICVLFLQLYMVRKLTGYTLELTGRSVISYVEEVKGGLNQMEQYAASFLRNNEDLITIQMTEDLNRLVLAENHISNRIINDIGVYSMIDLAMIAVCKEQQWYFMSGGSEHKTMQTELEMRAVLMQEGKKINTGTWMIIELAGKPFLGRIIRNGSAYCVVLRRADIISDKLRHQFDYDIIPYLADDSGNLYSNNTAEERDIWNQYRSRGKHKNEIRLRDGKYVISDQIPLIDNLEFKIFMPSAFVLEEVKWIKNVLLVFWLILLLMLGEYWIALRKKLVMPSQMLCGAMAHIEEEGEIETDSSMLMEMRTMVIGFNEMKKQIYELKIQAYEQQLREQKIYMQYLATQIRPHFFLNSLNILYSLAQIKRYDLIQKMTLALVSYFRYVFKNASEQVGLRDEIKHVQDYLEIQKMRFLDNFDYHIIVEENLEEVRILPFLLQTFVENSVKYGMDDCGKVEIFIEVSVMPDASDKIRILVRDRGKGFSDQELERMNNGEEMFGEEQIGIQNARQRLMLLYHDEAYVHLYNDSTGGAAAEICYPIRS